MADSSTVIIGLPGSGKTTFLAALWHLVTSSDQETVLRFANLKHGNATHLNAIAARWREAKVQDRTALTGIRLVSMNLVDAGDREVCVNFPDVPGEAYSRMWEDRDCEPHIADILRAESVLLFIHVDTITAPRWVVDEVAMEKKLGVERDENLAVEWQPGMAPTQVQVVDLLQMMRSAPLDVGPRRLAILLSAWDKAAVEGLSPEQFIAAKMPLLAQYLRQGADGWEHRIYGLSAQGGDYDSSEEGAPRTKAADDLRNMDSASERIKLVATTGNLHDLTEPIAWVMG